MKLTTEEIQCINQTLISKGVKFEDLKIEVLDHIASEIENEMEVSQKTFPEVYNQVFERWKESLKETSNLWGNFVGPRIVTDKLSSLYKSQYKFSLLAVLIFSVLMTTITTLNPEEYVYTTLKLVFSSVYFLFCLAAITSMFFIWKIKSKTISGKFFQKNCSFLVFNFYIIYTYLNGHSHLYRHYSRESIFMNFFEWFLSGFFFFISVYLIYVAVEHFRIIKKYKLV